MCHDYSNWPGPIKSPSIAQKAHSKFLANALPTVFAVPLMRLSKESTKYFNPFFLLYTKHTELAELGGMMPTCGASIDHKKLANTIHFL